MWLLEGDGGDQDLARRMMVPDGASAGLKGDARDVERLGRLADRYWLLPGDTGERSPNPLARRLLHGLVSFMRPLLALPATPCGSSW